MPACLDPEARDLATLRRTLMHVAACRALDRTTLLTLPCAHVRQIVRTRMPPKKRSPAQQAILSRQSHMLACKASRAISSYPRNTTFAAHRSLAPPRRFQPTVRHAAPSPSASAGRARCASVPRLQRGREMCSRGGRAEPALLACRDLEARGLATLRRTLMHVAARRALDRNNAAHPSMCPCSADC